MSEIWWYLYVAFVLGVTFDGIAGAIGKSWISFILGIVGGIILGILEGYYKRRGER